MRALFIIVEVILYFAIIVGISLLFTVFVDPHLGLNHAGQFIEHMFIGLIFGAILLGIGSAVYDEVYG